MFSASKDALTTYSPFTYYSRTGLGLITLKIAFLFENYYPGNAITGRQDHESSVGIALGRQSTNVLECNSGGYR